MKKYVYALLITIYCFSAALTFAQTTQEPTEVQKKMAAVGFDLPTIPFPAPDFSLKDISGKDVTLKSFTGDVIFLNFWATWCPPCRAEMPSIETLHMKYIDKNFTILAVNVQEKPETVAKFLEKEGFTFPVVIDPDGRISGGMYSVQGIPTTYIIDKKGYILGRLVGTREWDKDEVYEIIQDLLE